MRTFPCYDTSTAGNYSYVTTNTIGWYVERTYYDHRGVLVEEDEEKEARRLRLIASMIAAWPWWLRKIFPDAERIEAVCAEVRRANRKQLACARGEWTAAR